MVQCTSLSCTFLAFFKVSDDCGGMMILGFEMFEWLCVDFIFESHLGGFFFDSISKKDNYYAFVFGGVKMFYIEFSLNSYFLVVNNL
jgi:hypothetical protein